MSTATEISDDLLEPELEEAEEAPQPWDPEKIRIVTKTFALGQVLEMLAEAEIDLAPEFQRDYVWKERQQSRLIESVLLGIPLPMFYFNQDDQLKMQVVDGLQRLTTIRNFASNQFSLSDLEYLTELAGKRYEDLTGVQKRRFRNTQIQSHVIDPETPFELKFDIFKRINTGGSPLNAQEIRHCLTTNKVRGLLKEATELPSFIAATGGALKNARRMEDKEVVLRFLAFFLHEQEYPSASGLDDFLWRGMRSLDNHPESGVKALLVVLDRSMLNNRQVFGEQAFRKLSTGRKNPINRALFDCWSVALADVLPDVVELKKSQIYRGAERLLGEDPFVQSITLGTDNPRKVRYRFEEVRKVVREACGQ